MMRIGNTEHEYSKITCVNASREIMTRFIAHRTFNPKSFCSRPVDFFALLAAMTLLLAHLDAHYHREAINTLAHQRLSDRALLGQALEIMDVINNGNKDVINGKSAKLIRRLLDVEADAAEGSSYIAMSIGGDENLQEDKKDGKELRLHIPYLGFIQITRQGSISREPSPMNATSQQHQTSQVEFPRGEPLTKSNDVFAFPPYASPTDEQPHGYMHSIFRDSTLLGELPTPERLNAYSKTPEYDDSILQYHNSSPNDIALQLSPTAYGVNDWTFQGVDTAFFDSLIRGTSNAEDARLEQ